MTSVSVKLEVVYCFVVGDFVAKDRQVSFWVSARMARPPSRIFIGKFEIVIRNDGDFAHGTPFPRDI